MRKLFVLLSVLLTQQASAQYFQHTYGFSDTYESNGQFTPANQMQKDYVIAGQHYENGGVNMVHVIRCDDKGNISGAPYFNYRYLLIDPVTGDKLNAWATSVAEMNSSGSPEYIVVGTVIYNAYSDDNEVFVMKLKEDGSVIFVNRYTFEKYSLKEPKMKLSINNKEILITGRSYFLPGNGNNQDVFVFNIDGSNGAINWSRTYDINFGSSMDDVGKDIIENPYTANELLVVGSSNNYGLLLRLDNTTGAPSPVNPATIYKITGDYQEFSCIKVANNPVASSGDGFIVGGSADMNNGSTNYNMWTVLMNQFGNVFWSSHHDNGSGTPLQNRCNDIMERKNTNGEFEYYAIGYIQQSGGDYDVQVLKLNENGKVLNEFWYGNPNEYEFGNSINFSNTGGFAFSGTTSYNSYSQLLGTAYFNGVNPCDYKVLSFDAEFVDPSIANLDAKEIDKGYTAELKYDYSEVKDEELCYKDAMADGDNTRQAYIGAQTEFTILNNGNSQFKNGVIEMSSSTTLSAAQLSVKVVDLLGREIASTINYSANANGKLNRFSINCGQLNQGLYYIVLSDGKQQQSKTLLVR